MNNRYRLLNFVNLEKPLRSCVGDKHCTLTMRDLACIICPSKIFITRMNATLLAKYELDD